MKDDVFNVCICPGCGRRWNRRKYQCRHCGYESTDSTFPTIRQLLDGNSTMLAHDVELRAYTRAVVALALSARGDVEYGG